MLSALAIVLICSNWLAFAIGVVSNILVTVLCFMVHNEEIRVFRWGFAMVSIVELAECFVLTALQIGLEHLDGTTAVLLMGFVAYFPKVVVMIFYLAFLALFVLRTLSLPISFVYRYAIICGKQRLRSFFTIRNVIILLIFLNLTSLLISAVSVPAIYSYKTNFTEGDLQGLGYIVVVHFLDEFRGCTMFFCATCIVLFVVAYTLIGYTTTSVYRLLSASAISSKTKALQKELTVVMLLQALLPVIFTIVPMIIFTTMLYGNLRFGPQASLSAALLNWQTCFNPILTLWFVKPFRKKIASRFANSSTETVADIHTTCRAKGPADGDVKQ